MVDRRQQVRDITTVPARGLVLRAIGSAARDQRRKRRGAYQKIPAALHRVNLPLSRSLAMHSIE
jgi:hypothetical protein